MSASPAGQGELSKAFERMVEISGAKKYGPPPFCRHVQAAPSAEQQLEAEFGSGESRFALYGSVISYKREIDDSIVYEEYLSLQRFHTGFVTVQYLSPRLSSYFWDELATVADKLSMFESMQQVGVANMYEEVYGPPACAVDISTLERNMDNFVTAFSS